MTRLDARRIGGDTLIYLPGRAIPAVMTLATVAVLTRNFSTEDVGRYDLAMRTGLFLVTATALWMTVVIMRLYPACEKRSELPAFRRAMYVMQLAGNIAGLCILGAIWAWAPDRIFGTCRHLLAAAGLFFVGQSLLEIALATARTQGRPWLFSSAAVSNAVLRLPVGISLALLVTRSTCGMLWGIGLVTLAIYAAFFLRSPWAGASLLRLGAREKAILKENLAYGLPLGATMVFNFFLYNSDRYLLKYILESDSLVGTFAVASFLIDQPVGILLQTLMLAVFPAIYAMYETQGREATEELSRKSTRVYLLLCVPACVLLAVLSHTILQVFTNRPSYVEAYNVARWLAFASLTFGLSYYAAFGLHIAKRTGLLLIISLVSIAVNVTGNWFAIPVFGYVACGVVRLVSNTVLVVATAFFSRRYLRWEIPWASVLRIGLAAVGSGALVFAVSARLPENIITLAGLGGLGVAVYGALLLATGELSWREVAKVWRKPRGDTES